MWFRIELKKLIFWPLGTHIDPPLPPLPTLSDAEFCDIMLKLGLKTRFDASARCGKWFYSLGELQRWVFQVCSPNSGGDRAKLLYFCRFSRFAVFSQNWGKFDQCGALEAWGGGYLVGGVGTA